MKSNTRKKKIHTFWMFPWLSISIWVFYFLFQIEPVTGNSMYPHVEAGNWYLFVSHTNVERGDVVKVKMDWEEIFKRHNWHLHAGKDYPPRYIVKRVKGVGGDYLTRGTNTYIIPKNEVFLIGDNLSDSLDSRYFGPIPRDWIVSELKGTMLDWGHYD